MFDIHRCQRTGTFVCAIALSAFSMSGQAFAQYGNTPARPGGSGTMEMRPNQLPGQADVMLAPQLPAGQQQQQQQPIPRQQLQQPIAQQPQEFSQEVLTILKKWEQFGLQTQKLEGKHSRLVYDNTFKVKKVSQGEFYYENPDKGRIDLYAVELKGAPPEKGPNGELYQVQSETPESWICDGQLITHIDLARKEYDQVPIPQEAQGQNIIDSPLPFLFGLTVEKAKNRYILKTGDKHNPEKGLIHLVATPLLQGDAAEWSEAEVILDGNSFLPIGIKLLAPGGERITVYSFKESKRNKDRGVFERFGKDPFHPSLASFKRSPMHQIQEPGGVQNTSAESPQRTVQLPGLNRK